MKIQHFDVTITKNSQHKCIAKTVMYY